MKSVVHYLQSENFTRVRVGIGAPKFQEDIINYVIGPIPEDEKEKLSQGVAKAAEATKKKKKNGVDKAMNKFNTK